MNEQKRLTRRQMIKTLGTGTLLTTVGTALSKARALTNSKLVETFRNEAVVTQALPFDLTAVRLLNGPFLLAQQRDARYLMDLEPDRLLHNFRVNAGLTPKAAVYGGWESVEPWVEIRCHGHTLGHY